MYKIIKIRGLTKNMGCKRRPKGKEVSLRGVRNIEITHRDRNSLTFTEQKRKRNLTIN